MLRISSVILQDPVHGLPDAFRASICSLAVHTKGKRFVDPAHICGDHRHSRADGFQDDHRHPFRIRIHNQDIRASHISFHLVGSHRAEKADPSVSLRLLFQPAAFLSISQNIQDTISVISLHCLHDRANPFPCRQPSHKQETDPVSGEMPIRFFTADNGIFHQKNSGIICAIVPKCPLIQHEYRLAFPDHLHQELLEQKTDQGRFFEKTDPFPHVQIGSVGEYIADCSPTHQVHSGKGFRGMDVTAVPFLQRNQPTVLPQALHIFQTEGFLHISQIRLRTGDGKKRKTAASCGDPSDLPHLRLVTGYPCEQHILAVLRTGLCQKTEKIFNAGQLPSHRKIPEITGIK